MPSFELIEPTGNGKIAANFLVEMVNTDAYTE